jgi:hypothetical protein
MTQVAPKGLGTKVELSEIPSTPLKHSGLNWPGEGLPPTPQGGSPRQTEPTVDISAYTDKFQTPADVPVPQAAAPQQVQRPTSATQPVMRSSKESQTIQLLREKFGVKSVAEEVVEVGGFQWTFAVPRSAADAAFATTLIVEFEYSRVQAHIMLDTAIATICIVAINGTPLWQHFGLEPPAFTGDPFRPPRDVRYNAWKQLFEFLADESMEELVGQLIQVYKERIAAKMEAYLRDPLVQLLPPVDSPTLTTTSTPDTASQA